MQHINKKRRYIKAMQDIDSIAVGKGIPPSSLALRIVKENRPHIEAYVRRHGGNPHPNPAVLAAQACIVHENKIAYKQKMGVPDYQTAEDAVLAEDQISEDMGESDSFAPALLGTIFKAGKTAIAKINQKRVAKGKKPILSGPKFQNLVNKVKEHVQIDTGENGATIKLSNLNTAPPIPLDQQSDLNIIKDALIDQATTDAKTDWIKKNLPIIAIAAVVLFVVLKK